MLTERLEMRSLVEADRSRFVELAGDDAFMVYSGGVHSRASANEWVDRLLLRATQYPFAKQPVIERVTGRIVGYCGVDIATFEHAPCLEFGYRLIPTARGKGYATEAGLALLEMARRTYRGELFAFIDPRNTPSQRVIGKLGFTFLRLALVEGFMDNVYRKELG